MAHAGTVIEDEIERFSALAEKWWDERGPFAPLHAIGPARLEYIKDQIMAHFRLQASGSGLQQASPLKPEARSLAPLTLLDIGCGGGLISEPMARLGAAVTGVDASEAGIKAASLHAQQSGLSIDYQCTTAEALAAAGRQFDVVLALEIVEHVADPELFVKTCIGLARPGGLVIFSTLNRTAKAYALAIVGAEYVARILPRGTHDWKKFLRPSELARMAEYGGGAIRGMSGLVYRPLSRKWELDERDLGVNYLMTVTRPPPA